MSHRTSGSSWAPGRPRSCASRCTIAAHSREGQNPLFARARLPPAPQRRHQFWHERQSTAPSPFRRFRQDGQFRLFQINDLATSRAPRFRPGAARARRPVARRAVHHAAGRLVSRSLPESRAASQPSYSANGTFTGCLLIRPDPSRLDRRSHPQVSLLDRPSQKYPQAAQILIDRRRRLPLVLPSGSKTLERPNIDPRKVVGFDDSLESLQAPAISARCARAADARLVLSETPAWPLPGNIAHPRLAAFQLALSNLSTPLRLPPIPFRSILADHDRFAASASTKSATRPACQSLSFSS